MGYFACTNDALDRLTNRCNNLKTFKLKAEHCSDEYIAKYSSTTLRRVHLVYRKPNNVNTDIDLSKGIIALGNYAKNLKCFERDIRPFEIPAMIDMFRAIGSSLEELEIESRYMIGIDA